MKELPDQHKHEDLRFDVMRKLRRIARAKSKRRRIITRITSLALTAVFGWIVYRVGELFPADGGAVFTTISWTIRGSLLLLCGLMLLVFSMSFAKSDNP